MFLGMEPRTLGLVRIKELYDKAAFYLNKFHMDLDPCVAVGTLSVTRKNSHQVGFIYISHRYTEVHELGDRVTILRDGENEGTYRVADFGANPGAQPPRHLSGLQLGSYRSHGGHGEVVSGRGGIEDQGAPGSFHHRHRGGGRLSP